jgi:hypothetical protein
MCMHCLCTPVSHIRRSSSSTSSSKRAQSEPQLYTTGAGKLMDVCCRPSATPSRSQHCADPCTDHGYHWSNVKCQMLSLIIHDWQQHWPHQQLNIGCQVPAPHKPHGSAPTKPLHCMHAVRLHADTASPAAWQQYWQHQQLHVRHQPGHLLH